MAVRAGPGQVNSSTAGLRRGRFKDRYYNRLFIDDISDELRMGEEINK